MNEFRSSLFGDAPDILAQPIIGAYGKPQITPQTAYISPRLDSATPGYFDWLGAATHVADRRAAAMHGKIFLLDTGYAGIDEHNLYCRLDFMEKVSEWPVTDVRLLASIESETSSGSAKSRKSYRLETLLGTSAIEDWNFSENGNQPERPEGIQVVLRHESVVECRIPFAAMGAELGSLIRVRFSLWRGQLPLDALPQEGAIEVQVVPEEDLSSMAYAKP